MISGCMENILTETVNGMDGKPLNSNLELPKLSFPFQVCL